MKEPTAPDDRLADTVPLTPSVESALSYQTYPSPEAISGVWLRPLRKHRADNGSFLELFRLDHGSHAEGLPSPAAVRQISVSQSAPGRLNAFHIHPREAQNEIWTVVVGLLSVWLVDCRRASATEGLKQRIVLSGEEPAQLFIPSGVAHGYRAGPDGALLLYAMDNQFDPARPNEGRLPWDHFGPELWAEDRG